MIQGWFNSLPLHEVDTWERENKYLPDFWYPSPSAEPSPYHQNYLSEWYSLVSKHRPALVLSLCIGDRWWFWLCKCQHSRVSVFYLRRKNRMGKIQVVINFWAKKLSHLCTRITECKKIIIVSAETVNVTETYSKFEITEAIFFSLGLTQHAHEYRIYKKNNYD